MRPALCLPLLSLLLLSPAALAQDWTWPDRAENLQSLPEDFSGQRLRSVMTGFTRALGVRCSHCHVGEEGQSLATYDFASDDRPAKRTARVMLEMLGDINERLKAIEPSGNPVNMWCHTCHRGRARPMTLEEELTEVYQNDGATPVVTHYTDLRDRFYGRGAYDFSESALNAVGYHILEQGDPAGAVAVFQLNVEMFPASANAHDSLGEGYLEAGDHEMARHHYRRSLELDSGNDNARLKLEELGN